MAFQIPCPNCGPREVYEFRYGGQVVDEAAPARNLPGRQRERWFHRHGCRRWLVVERDLRTNLVLRAAWLDEGAS
jgi:sarcosine oxidase delta subunit